MRKICLAVLLLLLPSLGHADLKQKAADQVVRAAKRVANETHDLLSLAQKIGFMVDEVRFEMSASPKVEVFFRDTGDKGNFDTVIKSVSGTKELLLRGLQATRKFKVTHYSPTGVKLTTGVAVPKVEILSSFVD